MFAAELGSSVSPSTWAQAFVGLPYILGAG